MKENKFFLLLLLSSLLFTSCSKKEVDPSSEEEKEEEIFDPIPEEEEEEIVGLPKFSINTEGGAPINSKEVYVNALMNIDNAGKYDDKDLSLGIRGRGNYSWSGTEKKSYRIKFNEKYQPLGQGKGKAKSWTLLALHCDKSLLRSDAAFYFAYKLGNLPFVSSSSFVQLYLNDKYQGVYELCDQIQVNKNRVDIDDSGEQDDIGYLLELDKNAKEDVIETDDYETYEVKSDYVNKSQLNFLKSYMNDCYYAIQSGNKDEISSLIDLPSMIDAYLVEEVFKNLDVGWGSFYYTKPKGGKLHFGPVWDFDLSSGNADSDNKDSKFSSNKYTYVGNDYFQGYMQQHSWYLLLRECSWFNDMVKERFFTIKDYIDETIEHIDYMRETYHDDFLENFTRWKIFSKKINREPSAVMKIKSFDGQVDYLINWLKDRETWLNSYYLGEVSDI